MGAITLRLTDELQAFVEDAAAGAGYSDAEAFIQAMLMDRHGQWTDRIDRLVQEGLASGISDKSIDDVFEEARQRYRARQA